MYEKGQNLFVLRVLPFYNYAVKNEFLNIGVASSSEIRGWFIAKR